MSKLLSRRGFLQLAGATGLAVVLAACTPTQVPATQVPAATTVPTAVPTADPKAGWPIEFIVGYFGGDDPAKTMLGNEPLRAMLEKALGIKVTLITGTSYTAVIEAMRNKKCDAMEVGPFSYTLAVQEAGAEALAVGINTSAKPPVYDPKLVPYYYSIIFTKKGSGITTLADLKGRSFNFVDPASTSGHLMPKTHLLKNGIDPDKDTTSVFAGSHPTSVLSVWNDKADAGATYMGNFFELATSGQIQACGFADGEINKTRTPEEIKQVYDACPTGNLVILSVTDPIPNTPFAIRGDLPVSFKDAVKAVLLSVKDDQAYIDAMKGWYVDPTASMGLKALDQFYDPLRDIAKLLNLDLKKMK